MGGDLRRSMAKDADYLVYIAGWAVWVDRVRSIVTNGRGWPELPNLPTTRTRQRALRSSAFRRRSYEKIQARSASGLSIQLTARSRNSEGVDRPSRPSLASGLNREHETSLKNRQRYAAARLWLARTMASMFGEQERQRVT